MSRTTVRYYLKYYKDIFKVDNGTNPLVRLELLPTGFIKRYYSEEAVKLLQDRIEYDKSLDKRKYRCTCKYCGLYYNRHEFISCPSCKKDYKPEEGYAVLLYLLKSARSFNTFVRKR